MKNLNLVFKLLMMAILITGVTACSSKKDGKGTGTRDRRGQGAPGSGPLVPGGPRANVNQSCPSCGYIFANGIDLRIPLMNFLMLDPNSNELGQVSSSMGDSTGVFFSGNVSGQSGNSLRGQIRVVVWDSFADQSDPYVVQMNLSSSQSDLNSYARLTFSDGSGTLTLSGNFTQNGTYEGTVSFQNEDGPSQNLGNFMTGDCNFITAGCPQQ